MRLAYFSPLPPIKSGIADYSRELLEQLAGHAEITLFVDQPEPVIPELASEFVLKPHGEYGKDRFNFDLALYHMGNNVHHEAIYNSALRYPGVVVLHDLFLHHFIGSMTFVRDDYITYAQELSYALGSSGLELYCDIRLKRRRFPVFEIPLINRLVDRSIGTIVHSHAGAEIVQPIRPDRPTRVLPALITPMEGHSYREELGLPDEAVIFASLGFVNVTKQVEMALRAFARLRQTVPDIYYLIVGDIQGSVDLEGTIAELGIEELVKITGFVPDLQEFINWTTTADIVVNLRFPTLGETSAAALRAMAAAKPLIVFDHGWYAELSDEICCKVPPLDEAALLSAMSDLALHPERRARMGANAYRSAIEDHDPSLVAGHYLDFLKACLSSIESRLSWRSR